MKQILDYFDRAYIINLRDRPDRKRGVTKEFARLRIDVPSSKIQFYMATRPTEQGGFPTPGARGSFTSHRAVLDLARQDGLKNLLVFEDDVRFTNIRSDRVERMVNGLRQHDWDIAYFGYVAPQQISADDPLMQWAGPTTGGHFYGVNGGFIAEMAEYMHACELRPPGHPEGGPMFRDGAYNHVRSVRPTIRVLLAAPNLATQRSSRTDLHVLKLYDRFALLAPLVGMLRAAKDGLKRRRYS